MSSMKETRSKAFNKYGRQRRNLFMAQRRLEILKSLDFNENDLQAINNQVNRHNFVTNDQINHYESNNRPNSEESYNQIEESYLQLTGELETDWLIARTQALNNCFEKENFAGAAFQIQKFYVYLSNDDIKFNGRIQKFVRCGLIRRLVELIKNYFFETINSKFDRK